MLELFEEVIEHAAGRLPISVIISLVQMHGMNLGWQLTTYNTCRTQHL